MSINLTHGLCRANEISFFTQPSEDKMKVSQSHSKYFNGYKGPRTTKISPGEGVDVKESVRKSPHTSRYNDKC